MSLLSNKKLKHVIAALNRPMPVFSPSPKMEMQEILLAKVILLACQISKIAPEILDKEGTIKVLLSGTGFPENADRGEAYKLINKVLGTEKKWEIILTGNEINEGGFYYTGTELAANPLNDLVTVSRDEMLLSESIEKYGLPDILVLNHPGFEKFHQTWFAEGAGIRECLNQGVTVLGASYGDDEALTDEFYASAYGVKMSCMELNNLYLRNDVSAKIDDAMVIDAVNSGYCDWGRSIWKLESNGLKDNPEKLELMDDIDFALSSIGHYLNSRGVMADPNHLFLHLMREVEGQKVVRIYSQYSLNLNERFIFDEEDGTIIQEDIEIDCSDFDIDRLEMAHNMVMLMVTVFRDYIKEEIESQLEQSQELPASMMELMEQMGVSPEEVESMMSGVSGAFGMTPNREMTDDEVKIMNAIGEERLDEVLGLPDETLMDFKDNLHRNVAHLAAVIDSVELLKKAKEIGIDLKERDGDLFSLLDICGERNSTNVAKFLIEEHLVDDLLDAQDTRGFTPSHRAASYGSKEVFEIFRESGANLTLKNIAGLTPLDYLA